MPVPGSLLVSGEGLLTGQQGNLMIPIYLSGFFLSFMQLVNEKLYFLSSSDSEERRSTVLDRLHLYGY